MGALLDAALLISSRPLKTSWIPIQVYLILSRLRVFEPQYCTISSNKHDPCAGLYLFSSETADPRFGHLQHFLISHRVYELPYLYLSALGYPLF